MEMKPPYSPGLHEIAEDVQKTFYNPDGPIDDDTAINAAKEIMNARYDIPEQGENDD